MYICIPILAVVDAVYIVQYIILLDVWEHCCYCVVAMSQFSQPTKCERVHMYVVCTHVCVLYHTHFIVM